MAGSASNPHAPELIVDRERQAARIVLRAPAVDVQVVEPVEVLVHEAAAADVRELVLDFRGVSFADSSVVRLAMKARERLAGQIVIKAPPAVRRVFDLTGTAELFEIVPHEDGAEPA